MATITSVASGNWSDPNIWDLGRVPVDGDDVVITDGHTVIYDYDMSNWTNGLNSLKINGSIQETKIKCHRTQDTYLKFTGKIYGSNWQYSIFDWGTKTDPIQAKAYLKKNANTIYIDGQNLFCYFYGKDASPYITTTIQSANAGANEIYVDISQGWMVQSGDEIIIEVDDANRYTEVQTVQQFNAISGKITLSSSLSKSVASGAYVCILSRNIIIEGISTDNSWQGVLCYHRNYGNKRTWGHLYIKNGAVGISNSNELKLENISYLSNRQFLHGCDNIYMIEPIVGVKTGYYVINGSIANIDYGYFFGGNGQIGSTSWACCRYTKFLNCYTISHSSKGGVLLSCYIRNCTYLMYRCGEIYCFNTDIVNLSIITGSPVKNAMIYGGTTQDLSSLFQGVMAEQCIYKTYICQKGKTQFHWMGRCGKIKLDNSVVKNLPKSMKFSLEVWNENFLIDEGVWWDWVFHLQQGIEYKWEIWVRKNASVEQTKRPRIQIFKKGQTSFEGVSPLAEIIMTDSVDIWEKLEIIFTPTEDIDYIFRIWAGGEGYSCWWDLNPCDDLYIQKIAQKTSYIPDVGERSFDIVDISQEIEVIEL